MMALTRRLAVAAIIVNAALTACSRSPDESAKKDSAAADPMGGMDMPGMEMKKKPAGLR
jgi:hypothetical protein